ncbi:hypothetical protein Q5R05_02000 [Leuconostoc carnosum]|uniref:hypothetical protein n=1 Tax=Leuconostoc carnosum TaxID=1252 RepID=UPI000D5118D5|nr:hypothetical protein [Leuconostoc carnosum]WLC97607.1 hypothetical protein Q5R05_08090 [Leuconostoc carnosum]WLC98158.1 hypothetical protein Q5R05_02000 [Leuconostoc carnosum]SPJ44077.1 hypothetical protein LCAC16_80161 [Leuconostoc carnosum]
MSENVKHIVRNVTCNTYVEDYDFDLKETKDINLAKHYKNFKKAAKVAEQLTDEDCVYKPIQLFI